jgi:hypothetical protein
MVAMAADIAEMIFLGERCGRPLVGHCEDRETYSGRPRRLDQMATCRHDAHAGAAVPDPHRPSCRDAAGMPDPGRMGDRQDLLDRKTAAVAANRVVRAAVFELQSPELSSPPVAEALEGETHR